MTTKQLNFEFSISGVIGEPIDFRLRQNVKKRIASILYLEEPPEDSVRLKYVGSKEISPKKDLYIGDRSDELYPNSKLLSSQNFQFGKQFSVVSQNFMVTQEFVLAESGNIPLYYKHTLPQFVVPESIKVFDQNHNEVSSQRYKVSPIEERDELGDLVGYTGYYLFSSLESSFNYDTGEYVVYFVQYTDRTTGQDIVYTKLLSNELAYQPAQAEDFWSITPGELKPWVYVYYLDDSSSSPVVTMPADLTTYIQYVSTQRIQVKHPTDFSDMGPWFVRVTNGYFKSGINSIPLEYWIPEFYNQPFNPMEPYKFAPRLPAMKVTDRIVKLSNEDILEGVMFESISLVFEIDGIAQYAVTTNSDLEGIVYTDFDGKSVSRDDGTVVTWSSSDILSIDKRTGFIHLNFNVLDSYDIYASYPYIERCYTVNSLVMNPIIDRYAHRQTRVVYLVPQGAPNNNTTTFNIGIHTLKINSSGIIDFASADSTIDEKFGEPIHLTESNGFSTTGFVGLHYSKTATTNTVAQTPLTTESITLGGILHVSSTTSFPGSGWIRFICTDNKVRYAKYTSKEDTYFTLSSETIECPSIGSPVVDDDTVVELVNWIDSFTTLSSYDSSDEFLYTGTTYPSIACQYFVLAEMTINPPYKITDLTLIDIRENGGGIDTDKYEEAKKLNPEVQWYNDYAGFEGQIYPGNSVAVVKLPISLKQSFSLENIKQIVNECIPVGVLPIVRFYGYEPRIISILPGETINTIEVTWEKEGSEFVYTIWYSYNQNGPWYKATNTRIVDGSEDSNSYTISGLTPNIIAYVKITMEDKYYQWWYSYSSYDSIEGGLGLEEDPPIPPFGNVANFVFEVL